MYTAHIQKVKGGYRVVVVSDKNGKLVLSGETLKNEADAEDVRGTLRFFKIALGDDLPASHKFPRNAGPKKSTAKKK